MKKLFCLKAKNGLGHFTPRSLHSLILASLKLKYMLAKKLKDVTVAATRGRQQGDLKALGPRPRGV